MNMSDDLKGKIDQLLEAKPRLSFNNDGCDVLDKGGNCVRSFKQKDLGEKYKKSAEVFLQQNYSKLNAEGFVWKETEVEEGIVDAIKSKLHPSRPERNAASRRQDQEAAAKKAVKSAVASTVAKSLEKKEVKESEVETPIESEVETPMTNMERIASFISSQTKVQSADGTSMMGVKKDIQEKKMSKAEFKDMMAGKGKKDKGDMDGDGKHEPDDKEYMDNKDKAIKKSMGKKGKKDEMEEAIDQKSSDPEKSIGHNCATHVEHAVYGAGECIPGMHTLDETSEGEGVVTHYDVMFKIDNEPVIKENVRVEELKIVKEMHHGHKKKK